LVFLIPAQAKKAPPSQPIDINPATISQLEELPGIGPTRASKIAEYRMKTPFRRVEDLMVVPGISRARFDKLKPYIKVSTPSAATSSKKPTHPTKSSAASAKPSSNTSANSSPSTKPNKPSPKSPSDSCADEEEPN
jgi:competence ComEA-like helix-hairpin-helix protein